MAREASAAGGEVRARLAVVGAAALFSTGGAAIKLAELGTLQVVCLRSGVAAAFLLLVARGVRLRDAGRRELGAALAYAATMVLFVLANRSTTAAGTSFLQSTAPLYVLLFGPFLLREKAARRDLPALVGIGLGLALILLDPGGPQETAPAPLRGNLLAAGAGASWALTVMGLRAVGAAGGAPTTVVVLGNLLAALLTLPGALAEGSWPTDPGPWLVILHLGVAQIGLAYLLLGTGLKHVRAMEGSLLLLLEPALTPLWAWLVHREHPGAWTLAGGGVVLLALAWRARSER